MTIKITYTAKNYSPERMGERYVRAMFPIGYAWCERDTLDKRYDLRQGTCDAADLPASVRIAADRLLGHAFSYVDWPHDA